MSKKINNTEEPVVAQNSVSKRSERPSFEVSGEKGKYRVNFTAGNAFLLGAILALFAVIAFLVKFG